MQTRWFSTVPYIPTREDRIAAAEECERRAAALTGYRREQYLARARDERECAVFAAPAPELRS